MRPARKTRGTRKSALPPPKRGFPRFCRAIGATSGICRGTVCHVLKGADMDVTARDDLRFSRERTHRGIGNPLPRTRGAGQGWGSDCREGGAEMQPPVTACNHMQPVGGKKTARTNPPRRREPSPAYSRGRAGLGVRLPGDEAEMHPPVTAFPAARKSALGNGKFPRAKSYGGAVARKLSRRCRTACHLPPWKIRYKDCVEPMGRGHADTHRRLRGRGGSGSPKP
jgi:hypothetical protein